MNRETATQPALAYATAGLGGLVGVVVWLLLLAPLLAITALEETDMSNTETIADPLAWPGFALIIAASWVAAEFWLPKNRWVRAALFAALGALMGSGYLIGGPDGSSTVGLRAQGLLLVAPIGLMVPLVIPYLTGLFAGMKWGWHALIALGLFLFALPNLAALAARIELVPLALPLSTAAVLLILTSLRWHSADVPPDRLRLIGVPLVLLLAALGVAAGLTNV